jgi:DNA-binding transcriptional LysR family regulator
LEIQSRITNRESFDPAESDATFRIAASDYVSTVLLAQACAQLYAAAPKVRLEIFPMQSDVQTRLDRGDFDLIILPETYAAPNHPTERLFKDVFTCIVWSDNPLVGEELSLEQFEHLGHVGLGLGSTRAPTIEQHLMMVSGHRRRVEVVVSSFNTIAPFVVGTNRIATLQWRLAAQAAQQYPVRMLRPPLATPVLSEIMQWHSFQTEDPKHIWLRQMVSRCAAALPDYDDSDGLSRS